MNIYLKTLGCRLNEAEIERWAVEFAARGHRIAAIPERADVIVINTCAVTREAVRKSRRIVRRSRRINPRAKLVVSGCHATLTRDTDDVDLLVPNPEKDWLVSAVDRHLSAGSMPASAAVAPAADALFARGRSRGFIKVQDGCRHRCTFCVVTIARGPERSRSVTDIVADINRLHAQGVSEVVLTGVHLGGYGVRSGSSLPELLHRVLEHTSVPRIRLGSLEPWDLGETFLKVFRDPRLMPHLHLPLQSGCDRTLKRMARRCRTPDFERLLERLSAGKPGLKVTTDIIVGFPGETEPDWQESLAFVERMQFADVHVFPYSPRPGTAAAGMPDQASPETRKSRCRQLERLVSRARRRHAESLLRRTFPVLIEERHGGGSDTGLGGYTPDYTGVRLGRGPEQCIGEVHRVVMQSVNDDGELTGELLPRSAAG